MNINELKESIRSNTNRVWNFINELDAKGNDELSLCFRRKYDRIISDNSPNNYGFFGDLSVSELYSLDIALKNFVRLFIGE